MPILTFSSPRNRAVLITVLLIMEFMAIVWLRESSPDEGRVRVPFHSDASGRERHVAADSRALRHEESHLQRMQYEQRQRRGYVYPGAGTGAEATRSGGTVLRARAGARPDPQAGSESLPGSDRNKDDNEGTQEEPRRPLQLQLLPHQPQQPQHVGQLQQVEQQLQQQLQQQQQRLQPTEQGSIPSSSTRLDPTVTVPELPTNAKASAHSDASTANQPDQEPSSLNKNTMNDPTHKTKAGTGKHRSSPAHEKNQRGGFKSTKERKLAQLIPALDENGVVIEDHFISPRDTDGDGIPDIFVLLRPTANSRYMMDVGLFDEDIVPPPLPPPPVLPVTPVSPATPVNPAAPLVPLATPQAIPVVEATVPAVPQASTVLFMESTLAPELPISAALLSEVVEVANPDEPFGTSVEPAVALVVAPAEAQRPSTQDAQS